MQNRAFSSILPLIKYTQENKKAHTKCKVFSLVAPHIGESYNFNAMVFT
jgi:hypothetical protein